MHSRFFSVFTSRMGIQFWRKIPGISAGMLERPLAGLFLFCRGTVVKLHLADQ